MRILQLGKFYPIRGGVEKVEYDLMMGLSELGVDCDMMCALSEGGSQVMTLNENARLIGCRTWMKLAATMIAPEMIFSLRKRCQEYDVIHIHHPDPMACLALFLSGYKGKVVLHWHSDIEKQKMLLRFYMPLQKWLLKRADVIIGTTPAYLSASPYLKSVQDKCYCLPIGVEPITPSEDKVAAVRSAYPGKKIVFSLGRLVAYKGFGYLVEAARYLSDDYVVLIGGAGPLEQELNSHIQAWGLENKVKLLGRISDEEVMSHYGACSVFCLSSVFKTEAFGIVQIEAMSCGKPIVATRIPGSGVAWVNEHKVSGLNVDPKDAKQLAESIMAIAEDEDAYKVFCEGAEQRYRDLFTKEKMIGNLQEIYSELWKK